VYTCPGERFKKYFPSRLQVVPPFLSFIKTEAFGNGSPLSSLTMPETVWENEEAFIKANIIR
jgi:hypothetical protein